MGIVLFLGWSFISVFGAANFFLAWHQFLLIMQAFLVGVIVLIFFTKKIFTLDQFLWLIVVFSFFQSAVGFFQVVGQSSVGLYFLGEPYLDILNPQVAKTLVLDGGRLLRAYGTFVHPNVLGGFLAIGILSFLKLGSKHKTRIFHAIILFILILGLTLTFSRSAWLVGGLMTLFYLLKNKLHDLLIVVVIITIVLSSSLYWFVFPKLAFSVTEPSVALRIDYMKSGWEVLKNHPLIGVGIGNSVIYTKQPIHNLYLLMATEIGLIGLALFLVLIILSLRNSLEIAILTTVLLLGFFDHYLWTIPAGLIMLSVAIELSTS